MNAITPNELFDRCYEIATAGMGGVALNKRMHETLVMACGEGTRQMGQGFGNVFSQVDFLCKKHGVSPHDKQAIQTMRRHSNMMEELPHDDLMYDVRALCLFVSAVFSISIPDKLVAIIPTENRPAEHSRQINMRYMRCIVDRWDEDFIYVSADNDNGGATFKVDYTNNDKGTDFVYLRDLLHEGMQLNLLDCHIDSDVITPRLIVIEPDFLVDISSVAACFTDYGHNPISYTVNRLRPRANSQPILLGNFAGSALDDIINNRDFNVNNTITNSFKEQTLQFCTCNEFNSPQFIADAKRQALNLKEVVDILFPPGTSGKAVLEPSFVCEKLGLQGRADLMTADKHLLVEQKSGRNINIERNQPNRYHSFQREDHYVQLLLYYGVLRYNFGLSDNSVDIRLLYSRYPAHSGLLVVNYYRQLFIEAIKLRNLIVANEFDCARNGFDTITDKLRPETINEAGREDYFFTTYIRPQIEAVTSPLHSLSPIEAAYFTRMMTFVYREQLLSKIGTEEGRSGCVADLWNMPLHEKKETGNIYTDLTITDKQRSADYNGYDLITLSVPKQGEDFLPNFRRGDMVYLYAYRNKPDVRTDILYKGTLKEIGSNSITVKLNDGQQNNDVFDGERYAIEHASSDISTSSAAKGLHEFITAPPHRKALLLGNNEPIADTSITLSKQYNPNYDDILLRAKQSRDYFLLIGPPGTGKTSMALRYLVEEELSSDGANLLLMSYTNRAVDEICSMLADAGIDFMRLGNENSCDPRFKDYLLDAKLGEQPKLKQISGMIKSIHVIVGTTSTMQARSYIFGIKHFSLAIIDEASQILEPNIVGLIAAHRSETKCCIDRFILIGDYKQLPAVVQQSEQETKVDNKLLTDICLTNCSNSLFERLIRWERQCNRSSFIGILNKQGRMHPDIARFTNEMFYRREKLEPVPCPHQLDTDLHYDLPSQDSMDDVLKSERMIFIPSQFCRDINTSEKVNSSEARIVADTLRRIYRFYGSHFDADRTVGVIVPYRNQIAMIRREIEKHNIPELERISIDTVERYQGSQRDVIVYSFTIQNHYQLNFLTANSFTEDGYTIDRKLNVAITRARKQMIMTGNISILNTNPLFAKLINDYVYIAN